MAFNQIKYISEYNRQHYDEIKIKIPKGKRGLLRQIAAERHIVDDKGRVSVNRMVVVAIERVYGIDLSKP